LGYFRDRIDLLIKATEYLKGWDDELEKLGIIFDI
jgi:hypothetical protein